MGKTYASGRIDGKTFRWDFTFLVDTGATWIGLPQIYIDALGLDPIPDAVVAIETGNGLVNKQLYNIRGTLEGAAFLDVAVDAPRFLVGYALLQELGFVVDPARERIVPRTEQGAGPPTGL